MIERKNISGKFTSAFGREPTLVVRSPGRVNLIGEHTDYNGGFVLPAAIDKAIWFAVSKNHNDTWRVSAADTGESFSRTAGDLTHATVGWANYLLGVLDQLRCRGINVSGFDCAFGGDIPIGAGLSSSAALEAGFLFALNRLFDCQLDDWSIVRLAQKAENEFVGVKCGIMDQFANIFGRESRVMLLDCRSLEFEYIPFEREDVAIVLCDTHIHHELASSEYNTRREQCAASVEFIKRHFPNVESLRDVTSEMLQSVETDAPRVLIHRARHVIEENARVLAACSDLRSSDLVAFGAKMFASHESLRDLYEVSCDELDALVEIAATIDGVFGARMMGGGFGGCTINLVRRDAIDAFESAITSEYRRRIGKQLSLYITKLVGGTTAVD